MQRYYIDTDDGRLQQRDREGVDYADVEAVRLVALTALSDLMIDEMFGVTAAEYRVFVRDGRGQRIFRAALSFTSGVVKTDATHSQGGNSDNLPVQQESA